MVLRAAWLARPRPQRTPSSITCGTPLASKSAHSASVSDLCRTSDDTDAYRMTTCSSQDAASVIFGGGGEAGEAAKECKTFGETGADNAPTGKQ